MLIPLLLALTGDPKPVEELPPLVPDAQAVSPDHRRIAVSTRDAGVWVLDIATKSIVGRIPATVSPPESLGWNEDGSLLAVLHLDGVIEVVEWSGVVRTTLRSTALEPRTWDKRGIHFAAGGSVIIAALGGPPTDLVSIADGNWAVQTSTGDNSKVTAVTLSPDRNILAQGTDAGVVTFWDVRSGQRVEGEARVPNDDRLHGTSSWDGYRGIHSLDFDPSGSLLAIGGGDCAAYLWCRAQRRVVRTFSHCGQEFMRNLGIGSVEFSPDGARLLTTSFSFWELRVWDLASDELLDHFDFSGGNPCELPAWFSADGKRVVLSLACRSAIFDAHPSVPVCCRQSSMKSIPGLITNEEWAWYRHEGDYVWAVVDHHLVVRKIPDEEPVLKIPVREK